MRYAPLEFPLAKDDENTDAHGVRIYPNEEEECTIYNVYAPPIKTQKKDTRRYALDGELFPNGPYDVITGDMNVRIQSADPRGRASDTRGAKLLEEVMERGLLVQNDGRERNGKEGRSGADPR